MARDGLVPTSFFADVHPKFRTPWKSTILIGVFVGLLAGLPAASTRCSHLTNIGTLFAFVIVCAAVLIMRRTHPDAERPFRCPWVPLVPILGILTCLLLMFSLPAANWLRLFVWLADRPRHLLRLRPQAQRDAATTPPRTERGTRPPQPGRPPAQVAPDGS